MAGSIVVSGGGEAVACVDSIETGPVVNASAAGEVVSSIGISDDVVSGIAASDGTASEMLAGDVAGGTSSDPLPNMPRAKRPTIVQNHQRL